MSIVVILVIAVIGITTFRSVTKKTWKEPTGQFPSEWRRILVERVNFYNALNSEEKARFERRVHEFLLNHRVTGIKTKVSDVDRMLVAASAIIPIFSFSDWRYTGLFEVLIYPSSFNEQFETHGEDRRILGMVGTGYMEGKMILSQKALHAGFSNASDKRNTALHEFVHLIDKADGAIDGIPKVLLDQPSTIPWLKLVELKMDEIEDDESDINPYGATERSEFFPVVCEYFFERPKLLEAKHPALYAALEKAFKHEMNQRDMRKERQEIRRNSPCPCDSGLKFKRCCGVNA